MSEKWTTRVSLGLIVIAMAIGLFYFVYTSETEAKADIRLFGQTVEREELNKLHAKVENQIEISKKTVKIKEYDAEFVEFFYPVSGIDWGTSVDGKRAEKRIKKEMLEVLWRVEMLGEGGHSALVAILESQEYKKNNLRSFDESMVEFLEGIETVGIKYTDLVELQRCARAGKSETTTEGAIVRATYPEYYSKLLDMNLTTEELRVYVPTNPFLGRFWEIK